MAALLCACLYMPRAGGGSTRDQAPRPATIGAAAIEALETLKSLHGRGLVSTGVYETRQHDLLDRILAVEHGIVAPGGGGGGPPEVDAMVAATGGAGTAEDPWVGWESAATSGVPAFFRCGHFGTAGVLVYGGDHANVNGSKPGPHQTITGYARLHWRGAGMADQTTRSKLGVACGPGGGTTIVGLNHSGPAKPLVRTVGVRYVSIQSMTLHGNGTANCTLVLDGPSVIGFDLTDTCLTAATHVVLDIAPTWNTDVSESSLSNCQLYSIRAFTPSIANVRVGSSNALDLSFRGGTVMSDSPYQFLMAAGSVSLYDIAMAGSTVADIFFSTLGGAVKVFGCHTESVAPFLLATLPSYGPTAYSNMIGTVIVGLEDCGVKKGPSIFYEFNNALTIIDTAMCGGIHIGENTTLFQQSVRLNAGSSSCPNASWAGTMHGVGEVVGLQSVRDSQLVSRGALAKLNIGTAVTDQQHDGDLYLKHGGSIRWTDPSDTVASGGVSYQHVNYMTPGAEKILMGGRSAYAGHPVAAGPPTTAIAMVLRSDGAMAQFILHVGLGMQRAATMMPGASTGFSTTHGTPNCTCIFWSSEGFALQSFRPAVSHSVWLFKHG
jgi:hypothetical protein